MARACSASSRARRISSRSTAVYCVLARSILAAQVGSAVQGDAVLSRWLEPGVMTTGMTAGSMVLGSVGLLRAGPVVRNAIGTEPGHTGA
jgi:hypothetical protein